MSLVNQSGYWIAPDTIGPIAVNISGRPANLRPSH